MNALRIVPAYIRWHYTKGFIEAARFDKRLLHAVAHLFSLSIIFRTFFSPWKRNREGYAGSRSWYETFIFNSLMRILGMGISTVILFVGCIAFILAAFFSILVFIIWSLAPFLIILFFFIGVMQLIH